MFKHLSKTWTIDPRLEADTHLIEVDSVAQIRLMNDKRWPWIILVPVLHDLEDIDDAQISYLQGFAPFLHETSAALKRMGVCSSTNVATLGNVVKQMHWHVVGRNEGDPNWPAPVWGYESAIPYGKDEATEFINAFRKAYRGDRLL